MEQMMDRMLAKMDSFQEEMRTNQGKMEASTEKVEVLRSTLNSWMDIHHARTEFTQEEMKAKMDIHQEKTNSPTLNEAALSKTGRCG
jgi:hypothetical protein